jgi:Flp pilus assembly protein TadG
MILFLFMLAGIVDLGHVFNVYIGLSNAARTGARYGSQHPTDVAGIRARVKTDAAGAGITLTDGNIQPTCYTPDCRSGYPIWVQISYPVQPIVGLIWNSGPLNVRAVVWMVIF